MKSTLVERLESGRAEFTICEMRGSQRKRPFYYTTLRKDGYWIKALTSKSLWSAKLKGYRWLRREEA